MCSEGIKRGKLVVVSGPSGVGKSTICAEVIRRTGAFLSVSVTTRAKADKEVDGREYHFISKAEFEKKIAGNEFLEYAEVFGNQYGTPKEPVEKALKNGKTVILEIDVQGARTVKKILPEAIMVFILPPSQADLVGRMTDRARGEDSNTAKKRLSGASAEISAAWQYYDHMVINAEVNQAVKEIIQIIEGNFEGKK